MLDQPAPEIRPTAGTMEPPMEGAPPRPTPDEKTMQWTTAWWDETDNVPDHELMCEVVKRIDQELMPAWSDPKDPFKGRKPRELREREDDRRVNTPLAYLNVQQIVATTVPENHKVRWKPDPLANPTGLGADKMLTAYGKSVASILEKYTREVQWQDRLEGWVQESVIYPMGILKLYFERDTTNEPVTAGNQAERDGQDDSDRIKQIMEDLAANRIQQNDPQVVELADLLAGQGKTSEIEVRSGLVAQSVPLKHFRMAKGCTTPEDLYLVPWMAQDVMLSRKQIRKRFPFRLREDGTWTGVHPDDLTECSTNPRKAKNGKTKDGGNLRGRQDAGRSEPTEDQELLVREVWDRESGYVLVFISGLPYPAAKWKPEKGPEQWFPYHLLVLDRLPGQAAGVSKVELQMDEQSRINRKRSDEEIARYHSQPKGICDSTYWDQDKQNQSVNLKPYKLKGLPLGGNKIADVIQWLATPMVPGAYDTSQDRQDLQRAANISAQSLGVTGEADFAAEVEEAAQGTAISGQALKNRIRRALERLYDAAAQMIQQEVSRDEALELDPTVVWPTVYSDQEATQLYTQIRQEVRAQLLPQMMAPFAPSVDPLTGMLAPGQPMPPPQEMQRQLEQQAEPLVQQRCLETFGVPKPLSRQTLYRRLLVGVTVAMDAQVDRNKRLGALMRLFEAAAAMIAAAGASGTRIDIIPLMKQLAPLVEADEDLVDEMFSPDPNATAAMLLQVLGDGETLDPALVAALVQQLMASAPPAAPTAAP